MDPKNFWIFLTLLEVSQFNIIFIFSFSIFIPFSPITTPKNPTSLIFHLYFSSLIYKSFSANLFTTSSTTLSCFSSFSIFTILLSMKLATSSVLIKFYRISFIIIWNITDKFIRLKNIIISSNDSSRVVNTIFYLLPSFIYTLLYSHHKSGLVNTFLVLIFSIMSEIKDKE